MKKRKSVTKKRAKSRMDIKMENEKNMLKSLKDLGIVNSSEIVQKKKVRRATIRLKSNKSFQSKLQSLIVLYENGVKTRELDQEFHNLRCLKESLCS